MNDRRAGLRLPLFSLSVLLLLAWFVAIPSPPPLRSDWSAPPEARRDAMSVARAILHGHDDVRPTHEALTRSRPGRVVVSVYGADWRRTSEGRGASVGGALVDAAYALRGLLGYVDTSQSPARWIKVDVVTGETPISDSTRRPDWERLYEAGLDGLRAETAGPTGAPVAAFVLPSDPIVEGWFTPRRARSRKDPGSTWWTRGDEGLDARDRAQTRLAQAMGSAPETAAVRWTRFRTDAFLAPFDAAETDDPTSLFRGVPRGPEVPTPEEIRRSLDLGGDWLARTLDAEGRFLLYTYLPQRDIDPPPSSYSFIRHTACGWALLKLGRRYGNADWETAGRRAIAWAARHVAAADDGTDRKIVVAPGEAVGGLGHNAMLVIALAELGDSATAEERQVLEAVGRTLVRAVRDDGGFYENERDVQKRPRDARDRLAYEPGEALLALVMLSERFPDVPVWREAAIRAAGYQAGKFTRAGKGLLRLKAIERASFVDRVHWSSQALDKLARLTGDRRWARVAVEMGDAVLASGAPPIVAMLDHGGRPYGPVPEDYIGGFPLPGRVPRTTPSGSRAEALNASRRAAVWLGKDPARFDAALLRIAGFQRRNQFTERSCYFCPKPEKALGSFRGGLTDNEIRIDYVQHVIAGMADTLEWYGRGDTDGDPPHARRRGDAS